MFKASNGFHQDKKDIVARFLFEIGAELSDLIQVNGISVVKNALWGDFGSSDLHGVYSLHSYPTGVEQIIHVQAFPNRSPDPSDPLLTAMVRYAPRRFNESLDPSRNSTYVSRLLEQGRYGNDPARTAQLIADAHRHYREDVEDIDGLPMPGF
jgi:hypothetical protein